jgi:hypothetical protein
MSKPNELRAILIDPIAKIVSEIILKNDSYKRIPEALGCQLMERVSAGIREDIWIDEEGMLTRPNPRGYFRLRANGQLLAGRGLVLSHTPDGDSASTSLSVAQVFAGVEFVDHDSLSDESLSPTISIYTVGEDGKEELKSSHPVVVNDTRG